MKKELILFGPLLVIILVLSGCTDGTITSSGCSDNAINLIDYNVNPLENIYPGNIVTITFWLENKGDYNADNVKVDFFDIQEFVVEEITCERRDGDKILTETVKGDECNLGTIKSERIEKACIGEVREVQAKLRVPDVKGSRTVSFSVSYDYHGNSRLQFNIWKRSVKDQYGQKQESSTSGPVKVDIKSDFLLRRIINDETKTVNEWVEEGQKFTMKINVRDVGTLSTKSVERKMTSINFNYNLVSPEIPCNFGDITIPTKKPLECDMVVGNIDQYFTPGSIEVDYDYNYQFIREQPFNIQ